MSARPDTWMPIYWGDYARDTGHLNAAGHGAYLMLLKHYWCTGRPLNDDDDELWRIACCDSKREWMKLRKRIVGFFLQEDGRLLHKRVDEELAKAEASTKSKSEGGRLGAERRWGRRDDANGTDKSSPIGKPKGNASKSDAPSPSPSPSPREKDISSDFETWYRAYPRHEARGAALKAYRAARKTADAATLQTAAERYAKQRAGEDPKFTKLPATWLNGQCWLDEAGPSAAAPPAANGASASAITPDHWDRWCAQYARTDEWTPGVGPPPDKPGTRCPADIWARHRRAARTPTHPDGGNA